MIRWTTSGSPPGLRVWRKLVASKPETNRWLPGGPQEKEGGPGEKPPSPLPAGKISGVYYRALVVASCRIRLKASRFHPSNQNRHLN
jgi:hypothetical protein